MKSFWDERFAKAEYAYGEEPNVFFRQELDKLSPGRLLLAAEGEGRNAVYAASRGWQVDAFDASVEGKAKALLLAEKKGVQISYQAVEIREVLYETASFDALGLVYAHFPSNLRPACHRKLIHFLKPGGIVILEAFGPKHPHFQKLNPQVGGPLDPDLLFSREQLESDFAGFEVLHFSEEEIELNEGLYHVGRGSVVRFVGRKMP